ncbi:MAG: metalloregulator ArsR/SmtB family transcription factor [Methanobrevibacter sp.]|nr:metalloregulator ArsR/SmtB family transcription factor [Methanobrevibacter sp.]
MSSQYCEIKSVREDIIQEISKKMSSNKTYNEIANLFKVLGDFNRIRILCALYHHEFCVCELSLLLDMSQSAISHQLRLLRNNDIVKYRKENKKVFYSLESSEIISMIKKVSEHG